VHLAPLRYASVAGCALYKQSLHHMSESVLSDMWRQLCLCTSVSFRGGR